MIESWTSWEQQCGRGPLTASALVGIGHGVALAGLAGVPVSAARADRTGGAAHTGVGVDVARADAHVHVKVPPAHAPHTL